MTTLSQTTRDRILHECARYPSSRTALLPALKLAQAEVGYLPPETLGEVADLVGVSHAAANELVTFYSMLFDKRKGEAVVEVCVQMPCAFQGGERLLRRLSEGLGIAPGETTPDGRVTLIRTHECFGACHRAPMCRVNERYCEELDDTAIEALLEELENVRVSDGRTSAADGRRPTAEGPARAGEASDVDGLRRSAVGGRRTPGTEGQA